MEQKIRFTTEAQSTQRNTIKNNTLLCFLCDLRASVVSFSCSFSDSAPGIGLVHSVVNAFSFPLMTEKRLFFALWPGEELRRGIVERRDLLEVSGRRVPEHNLHLTLSFLGNQPADRVAEVEQAAQAVAGSSRGFDLCLDRFGWFPGARVVWLGGEAPDAAAELATGLGGAMQALDLKFDPRPFKPHVSLLRHVRNRPDMPRPPPLAWPVSEFSLIESISGQPYQVLRKWRV